MRCFYRWSICIWCSRRFMIGINEWKTKRTVVEVSLLKVKPRSTKNDITFQGPYMAMAMALLALKYCSLAPRLFWFWPIRLKAIEATYSLSRLDNAALQTKIHSCRWASNSPLAVRPPEEKRSISTCFYLRKLSHGKNSPAWKLETRTVCASATGYRNWAWASLE